MRTTTCFFNLILSPMRKMSFWKTLFCSAMAVAAFSACSDDDTNDGGYEGIPEITVDGGGVGHYCRVARRR